MTDNRVTPITQLKQPSTNLLDRARNGRRAALADRVVTVIQASDHDGTVVEHRFPTVPRIVDLVARLGGTTQVLGIKTEQPDQTPTKRST